MTVINIKFLSENAKIIYQDGEDINYKTKGSSGFDIRALGIMMTDGTRIDFQNTKINKYAKENIDSYILMPNERILILSGFATSFADQYELQIRPRSGLALKNGLTITNSPGTIDSDYRGEVGAIIQNCGKENFIIKLGDRIAQAVLCPVIKAKFNFTDELEDTIRGIGGFGSTGNE